MTSITGPNVSISAEAILAQSKKLRPIAGLAADGVLRQNDFGQQCEIGLYTVDEQLEEFEAIERECMTPTTTVSQTTPICASTPLKIMQFIPKIVKPAALTKSTQTPTTTEPTQPTPISSPTTTTEPTQNPIIPITTTKPTTTKSTQTIQFVMPMTQVIKRQNQRSNVVERRAMCFENLINALANSSGQDAINPRHSAFLVDKS